MAASKDRGTAANPDQLKLTPIQAKRLGAMSDVSTKELVGLTVLEIKENFNFRIDPMLLFFRKVCGKVVKKDPITGIEYPVPFATVHVEDTDCSFLGFFPSKAKWAWYFPFKCHREVIATAKTDECGNFCIWIPRWDIDWVLRFRHERFCFPIIFERPSVRDLLDELIPHKIPFPEPDPGPFGPRPGPGPDPSPLQRFDRGRLIKQIEDQLGRDVAKTLDQLDSQAAFGMSNIELNATLESPAFDQQIPPPFPKELRVNVSNVKGTTSPMETVRSTMAARLRLDASELKRFDLRAFIGPFKRCFDVFIPEWVPIIDVPDITFRVTQDTNGDGVEETIYSEGYFQVRWDAGPIGTIKISAGPHALAGKECGGDPVPCGNTPAIVLAGRMPVVNMPTIYDSVNGYALRPNRPHPSGLFSDPLPNPNAASPFMGGISLFGCNKTDPKATHYRIVYKHSSDGGVTFPATFSPFVGLTWPLFRLDGGGNPQWHYPTPDSQGWYPIALPAGPNPFLPQDLLLDWPTYAFANGRYILKLEVGTGGAATSSSAEVAFNIDNAFPKGPITVEWRKVGGGAFQQLVPPCPLVRRGVAPVDIEFRVTLDASATHLRSAELNAGDCGGGAFVFVSGTTEHWHTDPFLDNSEILQAIFHLPSTALQGTYSFSAEVASRAFNPNDISGALILPNPWEFDPKPLHIYPYFAFSVINAN